MTELYPEEERIVAKAVPQRRAEFASARYCARQALGKLGVPPAPLLATERGAPRWPESTVGSITHCAGYRAAAVAAVREVRTVGIDAEPNEPTPNGVLGAVTVGGEQARVERLLESRPEVRWDRLLFSAKESVYKAWHPITGRWLDFAEAELHFTPHDAPAAPGGGPHGTFTARILVPPGDAPARFDGRWAVRGGLVLTAITVPA
nr:4'-phosphopantetheinyl transferase superfamily protein [Streptomyces boncukensis]